jgi:hypothetical protein
MAGRGWRGESEVGNGEIARCVHGLALSRSWVTRRPIWDEYSWYDPWRGFSHFLRDLAAPLVTYCDCKPKPKGTFLATSHWLACCKPKRPFLKTRLPM